MAHGDRDPLPHPPGCFGCKVAGLSFAGLKSAAGGRKSNPIERKPVIADEGPRRGRVVGEHAQHWDGRQDATARPGTAVMSLQQKERE